MLTQTVSPWLSNKGTVNIFIVLTWQKLTRGLSTLIFPPGPTETLPLLTSSAIRLRSDDGF